jgi:hypothetical protein
MSKKKIIVDGIEAQLVELGTKPAKDEFHQIDYKDMLALALVIRSPVLALWAELHHLHFASYYKDRPLELNYVVWQWAKFNRHVRDRALKTLEKIGLVEVRRRGKGRSPLVTLRHQNCLPDFAFYTMGVKPSPEAKAQMLETIERLKRQTNQQDT